MIADSNVKLKDYYRVINKVEGSGWRPNLMLFRNFLGATEEK
jgi:hypothetical protein